MWRMMNICLIIMIYFFIMCFLTVYHAYQIEIASRVMLNVVGGVHSPLSSPKGTEVIVHYYKRIHMLSPCGNLCVCYAKYV